MLDTCEFTTLVVGTKVKEKKNKFKPSALIWTKCTKRSSDACLLFFLFLSLLFLFSHSFFLSSFPPPIRPILHDPYKQTRQEISFSKKDHRGDMVTTSLPSFFFPLGRALRTTPKKLRACSILFFDTISSFRLWFPSVFLRSPLAYGYLSLVMGKQRQRQKQLSISMNGAPLD